MDDTYIVRPHILRTDEDVIVAEVDGVDTLIVHASEAVARRFVDFMGLGDLEPRPVTVEEIEELCAVHGVGCVGLFGLDGGVGLDVFAVETLSLVLTERT